LAAGRTAVLSPFINPVRQSTGNWGNPAGQGKIQFLRLYLQSTEADNAICPGAVNLLQLSIYEREMILPRKGALNR
jgi:hypothetical protein